jgi:hypothetical protein
MALPFILILSTILFPLWRKLAQSKSVSRLQEIEVAEEGGAGSDELFGGTFSPALRLCFDANYFLFKFEEWKVIASFLVK